MPNQSPLNPDGVLAAKEAMRRVLELDSNEARTLAWEAIAPADYPDAVAKPMLSAYLAVAQPVVNSVEELDALQHGTVIMATGGNWNPEHPELFLNCGYKHAPWMALDPSDRDDGENLESSGAVLRWRCDGEARVLHRPAVDAV